MSCHVSWVLEYHTCQCAVSVNYVCMYTCMCSTLLNWPLDLTIRGRHCLINSHYIMLCVSVYVEYTICMHVPIQPLPQILRLKKDWRMAHASIVNTRPSHLMGVAWVQANCMYMYTCSYMYNVHVIWSSFLDVVDCMLGLLTCLHEVWSSPLAM